MLNLKSEFHNFQQNIKALELFIKAQEDLVKINFSEGKLKKDEDTRAAAEVLKEVLNLSQSIKKEDYDLQTINEKFADKGVNISINENKENSFSIDISNSEMDKKIQELIKISDLIMRQRELIYRNSLTSLMIYFENLVSKLMKMRLSKYPNAFNPGEKSIKYKDLRDFESINEALDHLIENEIIEIMHGGFKSWINYLNKAGVNTANINMFIEQINEAYLRRNLFVHNDGIVNNVYLKKVSKEFSEEFSKGKPISISEPYLNKVIKDVKIFGTILLLEGWKTFDNQELVDTFDYIFEQGFNVMKEQDWEFAKFIYEFLLPKTEVNATKISTQMNIWLCEKELGNFEEISETIKKYDVSGLQIHYQLCKLSLLENTDEFFETLEKNPDSLSVEDLREWPILEYMRKDYRMEKFLQEAEGVTVS